MNTFRHQKVRDMGDIITDSFAYIRQHYKSLGKGLLFFSLPFYLIASVLVGNSYSGFFEAALENPMSDDMPVMGGDFWLGLVLFGMATASIFAITLQHISISRETEKDEITTQHLLEDYGLNVIYLMVMYTIIIISVTLGLMFFIIPGIYIGVRMVLGPAAMILENKNPIQGINRSWELVRGYWWNTFGTYLVLYIITTMMSYVLIIPFSIIIGLMSAGGMDTSLGGLGSVMSIFYGLMLVVAALFSVILIIGLALQYFNLKERQEGTGLREQIEELR